MMSVRDASVMCVEYEKGAPVYMIRVICKYICIFVFITSMDI